MAYNFWLREGGVIGITEIEVKEKGSLLWKVIKMFKAGNQCKEAVKYLSCPGPRRYESSRSPPCGQKQLFTDAMVDSIYPALSYLLVFAIIIPCVLLISPQAIEKPTNPFPNVVDCTVHSLKIERVALYGSLTYLRTYPECRNILWKSGSKTYYQHKN